MDLNVALALITSEVPSLKADVIKAASRIRGEGGHADEEARFKAMKLREFYQAQLANVKRREEPDDSSFFRRRLSKEDVPALLMTTRSLKALAKGTLTSAGANKLLQAITAIQFGPKTKTTDSES